MLIDPEVLKMGEFIYLRNRYGTTARVFLESTAAEMEKVGFVRYDTNPETDPASLLDNAVVVDVDAIRPIDTSRKPQGMA